MNLLRLSFFRLIGILLVGVILPSAAFAQSSLVDDAHTKTSSNSADSNFGNNPNLTLSSSGNIYLKFDLASSLPAGTPGSMVDKAVLTLFIGSISSPGKLDVYEVTSAWQESTITGNNAPMLGTLVATTQQITADQKGKFLVIDITSTVQRWLGSDGQGAGGIANHGIALVANLGTPEIASITFDSKENPQTSHEPRLNILLKGEPVSGLQTVAHDTTLAGDGTNGSPLGVANGGVGSTQLSNGAVTQAKLGDGAVTAVKLADGAVTSAKISTPLSLASADPAATLSVSNTGAGAAITANGAINTATQYNIGGRRMFSASGPLFPNFVSNTFIGDNAGRSATPAPDIASLSGKLNSLFGAGAGELNTTGTQNSFFGFISGASNTVGENNAFFGGSSGVLNSVGSFNAFFGFAAGLLNTNGGLNAFFGSSSGLENVTGFANSFFGPSAGRGNQHGHNNTIIGAFADVVGTNLQNATAIGALARVSQSNSLVLGSVDAPGTNVGIGTTAPADRLHVSGIIRVDTLAAAGADHLCRNASNQISSCSSSLRYKDRIAPFTSGLDLIERLRPITFSWRAGGSRDLGLGAEEVAEAAPLLVTRNGTGEVEGVKYDRIAVVLVNAVKEQQQLIKAQQLQLESQQRQIELLKQIVCRDRPDAQICK